MLYRDENDGLPGLSDRDNGSKERGGWYGEKSKRSREFRNRRSKKDVGPTSVVAMLKHEMVFTYRRSCSRKFRGMCRAAEGGSCFFLGVYKKAPTAIAVTSTNIDVMFIPGRS